MELIEKELESFVKKVSKKHNVDLQIGKDIVLQGVFKKKTTQKKENKNIKVKSVKKQGIPFWEKNGFESEIIGKNFTFGTQDYKIVDIKKRKKDYPIVTQDINGKEHLFSVDHVKVYIK